MLEQLADDGGRRGHHIRADLGAFQHMHRVADGSGEDLGLEGVIIKDEPHVADQVEPIKAIVIVPTDKGRDEGGPRLCRQQRLIGRKAQCDIHHGAIAGQLLAGFEAIDRQRHLDADIAGDLAQDFGLAHHALMVERDDFGRNRAIDQRADFLGHLQKITARLGDQRGVGGHAIQQARGGQICDVGGIGGVDEEFLEWLLAGIGVGV